MDFRKLFFALLLAVVPAIAQDCTINFRFTAAGSSTNFDNRTKGCITWTAAYTSTGFSVLSLTVQGAPDASGSPGAFGTVTAASGSNPNTAITQASTTFSTYFPWMRLNLAGLTGSGSVTGTLYGWRTGAQAGSTSGGGSTGSAVFGPDAPGSAPTQPPVQIGLSDGTNVRRIAGTSAGHPINVEKSVSAALADAVSNTAVVPQGENSGSTVPYRPALLHSFNGTTWDRLRSTLNGIFVQGSTTNGNTPSGTFGPVVIGGRRFGGTSEVQTLDINSQGHVGLQGGSAGLADNDSNSVVSAAAGGTNGAVFAGRQQVFDPLGANWDRMRGNDNGLLVAGFSSGAAGTLYGMTACDSSAVVTVAAGNTTEIVALNSGRRIRVCQFSISADTAATTAQWKYGTGTNCGTGTTNLTGAYVIGNGNNVSAGSGLGELFKGASSNAICLTAATGAVSGHMTYAAFP